MKVKSLYKVMDKLGGYLLNLSGITYGGAVLGGLFRGEFDGGFSLAFGFVFGLCAVGVLLIWISANKGE